MLYTVVESDINIDFLFLLTSVTKKRKSDIKFQT